MEEKTYIAIDLKSFYASVECVERGLDPLRTNLVVADISRTEKTICLAVSPALKAWGIPGRPRLFEVVQKVKEINALRRQKAAKHTFRGSSCFANELENDPSLALDYIVAPPQMAHYMEYSTRIYRVYLKYAAPEDIHVYSIDEVFIDATDYLKTARCSAHEFTARIIRDVLQTTGITATAGIGTNLYLCKIAMDIVAKHMPADKNGVRIASLDEQSYRRLLWDHRPLTDFWRVGRGIASRLEAHGLYTMGDIARCSVGAEQEYYNEELLYKLFGINAQLLIDHAWGWEDARIADIKAYRPVSSSLASGQVLKEPYPAEAARLVTREMTDLLVMDLVDKGLMTDQLTITLGYDVENLTDPARRAGYAGEIKKDFYGRQVPKHAHGTVTLPRYSSSTRLITEAAMELFDRIADPRLTIRRINVSAGRILPEEDVPEPDHGQMSLFEDPEAEKKQAEQLKRERERQKALLSIRRKYGKNAILKGMNLEKGATAVERNGQIGGHKA